MIVVPRTANQVFWIVGSLLTLLTIVEFIIAVNTSGSLNFVPLAVIAVGKAALIVYFFMHMYRLWRGAH